VSSQLLTLSEATQWTEALARCGRHDIYHLPEYHRVAQMEGHGEARLLVVEDGGKVCALPFLVRAIDGQPWLTGSDRKDATSVYGYAGPISNVADLDLAFRAHFHECLQERLLQEDIVSLFCRLHPLLHSDWLLEGIADLFAHGSTVAVDLDSGRGEGGLSAQMSANRRREVRKLREAGIEVRQEMSPAGLREFAAAYLETMQRASAAERYLFDLAHFERLCAALGERMQLLIARDAHGVFLSGILVFACGDILQYHLSATPDRFVRLSAVKLLIAEAALWGIRHGFRVFHLGGGVGASESDGVFQFKRGFSSATYRFRAARLVSDVQSYARFCQARAAWGHIPSPSGDSFFPEYRAPIVTG
jgi:hypothetical protein